MTSAVIMAGYQNKREVKRYSKVVAENYGESFIESGYKPLREFPVVENRVTTSKPLIQFMIDLFLKADEIEEIVIVGHQMLLEQRLGDYFKTIAKPLKIVNQNNRFTDEITSRFRIVPKHVKHNSLAGNMIKGYMETKASQASGHVLFAASDSPLTSLGFVEKFLSLAANHLENAAIIIPAVFINAKEDKLGRKPLKLINDSGYSMKGYIDPYGRQGFRLSSLLMANLDRFDVNTINTAYSLRKSLNPAVQIRLFNITRNLGFANVYSKYFIKRDLSITDCEKITSGFFRGALALIPVTDEAASFDYDGTEREYEMISGMLVKKSQQKKTPPGSSKDSGSTEWPLFKTQTVLPAPFPVV
jgi:hypothetical protein